MNDIDLSAVDGSEALAAFYEQFFRYFVMRKKQDLVNPRFLPVGEITLPRRSLLHYFPKDTVEIGPSRSEGLVSNFQGEVFLEFVTRYNPVLGNGRNLVVEIRKAIQSYRASHYDYFWTKDIKTVYNKDKVLIVRSYGFLDKMYLQRAGIFINYERFYNHFHALIEGIKEENSRIGVDPRHQFIRIDLPINFPGFVDMSTDYDNWVGNFDLEKGMPVPTNQAVRMTKAEGSYWLLEFMAFLFGDYEYTQFGKLTEQELNCTHIIFMFNSRSLIINLGVVKGWLDGEHDKGYTARIEKEDATRASKGEKRKPVSHRAGHGKRLNASKRFYLALMNLSRGGISEEEKDNPNGVTTAENAPVAEGTQGVQKESTQKPESSTEQELLENVNSAGADSDDGSLLDVFRDSVKPVAPIDNAPGEVGGRTHTQDDQEWNSEVDETLLVQEKVETAVVVRKDQFANPEDGIRLALEQKARETNLSVAEYAFFMKKGTQYKTIKMNNGQTMEEFIKISPEEIAALKEDATVTGQFTTILDESQLQSKAMVLKKGYVERIMYKDVASMFLGIQNAGFALNNYKHEEINSVEGEYDVFSVQFHEVSGEQSTHVIRVSKVQKDGTFTVDGVKNHMQLQRRELPIRKINGNQVVLSSYYPNRLMVQRTKKMAENQSVWMGKQILLKGKAGELTFNRGTKFNRDYPAPRVYSALATKFQWIKTKDYTFDFRIDDLLEQHPDFKKYTKKENFLVGVKNGKPLTVDGFGYVYLDGAEIGSIEGLMGISLKKAPVETVNINISGFNFPIGVVLCWYFGIDELIKLTKATTRVVPITTRPKLDDDEYAIAFNDEYLIFNRREKLQSMIFGGLVGLGNISNFSRGDLNGNGIWGPLMAEPKVKARHFQEMKNLNDLFLDPIHKKLLQEMKYSENFPELLIDAVRLLETDQARNEVELEEQRIVGYERFPGHIYTTFCEGVRAYRGKGTDRKHKLEINPDAVTMKILTDTSVNLVEEVGPVHQCKDQEELTFGGTGGRSEITVTKSGRGMKASYRGRIGEAHKDSGKVGFVTYTTSDPLVANYRGLMDMKGKVTDTGLLSVTGNLSVSITKDDAKRQVFVSTQWSQAVSAQNYTWGIVRTGYDSILPHRTSELYSKVASRKGKVTALESDQLTVTYDDGSVDKYPLGLVVGEASGEYHRHTRVTDLKVGDKFDKGDIIGWDDQWIARDPFNPGQAVLKKGQMVRMILVEDQDTYEDSIAVSKELAEGSITPFLNPAKFKLRADQSINMLVKIGDEVDYDAILCEIDDSHVDSGMSENSGISNEINRLGIKQVRSRNHGKIVGLDVKYNAPVEDMTPSVKKLVATADKARKRTMETEGKTPVTGAVNSNLKVVKPVIPPGLVEVSIMIETLDGSTTADKFVVGNQMKATTGFIMPEPIHTEDGKAVHLKQSYKGVMNRIVNSLRDEACTNETVIGFSDAAAKVYRGVK